MASDSWNPAQYEKFKNERSQPFFDLMSLLQPVEGARIVDLGCGTGELTAELHQSFKARQTTGVDNSEKMLAKARALSREGLSFENADIAKWKPKDRADILFSNAALQWCSDHPKLFKQMRDVLAPSGQIAIQMPMNHDYPTHVLAAEMSRDISHYDQSNEMLSPEEYASLLFQLGFHEQKVFLRVYGHVLESREGVVEWVQGTLLTHFKSRLSEADYERFFDEYRSRLFERLPDDRPFFYPFKRILIWGRLGA